VELILYWRIVRKRLWLVLSLLAILLLSYFFSRPEDPPCYTANMRLVIGLRPEPGAGDYYTYDRYYTWLTAEYLLDDFAEVVKSEMFARDISINWPKAEELRSIADAVVQVVRSQGDSYFSQLSTGSATISVIDPPSISKVGPSLRQRLDLPLRLLLGLGAGVGLAFLLDYLDDTIRDRIDLEDLGLTILAEIPVQRRWFARLLRRR